MRKLIIEDVSSQKERTALETYVSSWSLSPYLETNRLAHLDAIFKEELNIEPLVD
jgi:hypothetical protein